MIEVFGNIWFSDNWLPPWTAQQRMWRKSQPVIVSGCIAKYLPPAANTSHLIWIAKQLPFNIYLWQFIENVAVSVLHASTLLAGRHYSASVLAVDANPIGNQVYIFKPSEAVSTMLGVRTSDTFKFQDTVLVDENIDSMRALHT